jgi:hypothetical protein
MNESEKIFIKHIMQVSVVIDGNTYNSIAAYHYNNHFIIYNKIRSLRELVQFLYETNPELIDELKSIHFDEIRTKAVLIRTDQRVNMLCTEQWYQCMLRLLQNEAEYHNRYVLK